MGGLQRSVCGGATAARVGVVDEVVVHQRGRLEDLQGCADIPQRRRLLGGAVPDPGDGLPPRVAEPGAQSLAADQRVRSGLEQARGVGSVVDRLIPHPVDEQAQTGGDGVGDEGGGRHDSQHT